MPCVTYLNAHQAQKWARVPDDKECDELLQELRTTTGENWIIERFFRPIWHPTLWKRIFSKEKLGVHYTLYADCHGEWQVMSLVTPNGSSLFHSWPHSREAVMNYMLGYLGGYYTRARRPATPTPHATNTA